MSALAKRSKNNGRPMTDRPGLAVDPVALAEAQADEARRAFESVQEKLNSARSQRATAEAALNAAEQALAGVTEEMGTAAAVGTPDAELADLITRKVSIEPLIDARRQGVVRLAAQVAQLEGALEKAQREHHRTAYEACIAAGTELATRLCSDFAAAVDQARADLAQLRTLAVEAAAAASAAGLIRRDALWMPPWSRLASIGRNPTGAHIAQAVQNCLDVRRGRATAEAIKVEPRYLTWNALIRDDPERARALLDACYQADTFALRGANTAPRAGGRFTDSPFAEAANLDAPPSWASLRSPAALQSALAEMGGPCPRDIARAFADRLQRERRERESKVVVDRGPVVRISSAGPGLAPAGRAHLTEYAPPWRAEAGR